MFSPGAGRSAIYAEAGYNTSIVKKTKVIVGMSGGVDSSVAAKILIDQGYAVEGLFMKNWEEDDGTEYCSAIEDLADAGNICEQLGIQLHTANFAAEYWDNVFEDFLKEYAAGRTPNPDVLCNREIKFKLFSTYATRLGADYIATGHYVRGLLSKCGSFKLFCGIDSNKDQSYFLQDVPLRQLAKCLFPLGDLTKPEVRAIAEQHGFRNHQKKDSTGICFIGERRFRDFLGTYLPSCPGDIYSQSGVPVGKHIGLAFYTLGQRQGLGIGGAAGFSEAAWYVLSKNLESNRLIVTQDQDLLDAPALVCSGFNWLLPAPPSLPLTCSARIRYRQGSQPCVVSQRSEGGYHVQFCSPQRAITPGQYVCLYQDQQCLGGGVIESV